MQRQEDGHSAAVQIERLSCKIGGQLVVCGVVQGSRLSLATGSLLSEIIGQEEWLAMYETLADFLRNGNYFLKRISNREGSPQLSLR